MLNMIIEKAAQNLRNWEKATKNEVMVKYYNLAYDYTRQALELAGDENKELIFKSISDRVLTLRVQG